jgi:outer membrane protein
LFIAVLIGAPPGIAAAADLPPAPLPPAPTAPAAYTPDAPDWIVTIGLEPRIIPAWPGAPESKFGWTALPLFDIRKAGTPPNFFAPRDSLSFPVVDLPQFKVGPAVRLIWERKASDYMPLTGLANVNYAIQAGGFAEFWAVPWLRLRGELRQGVGGETGLTGDVFLDAVVPLGQFRLSGGPRLTLQTAAAVSPYFSITAAQAAAANLTGFAPLTAYNAGGGLYSYGAGAQAEYFWSPQWATHVFAEYERLTGDAANSPLVIQRGSPNQFTFGAGATYSFTMHPFW